jgi:putative hydrolase of the HAD superfamily
LELVDRNIGSGLSAVQQQRLRRETRQTLFVDADDTLWHNNHHFEQSIHEFIEFLDHSTLSPEDVRAVLDEIEMANARVQGYGALAFAANLRLCYERLCERDLDESDISQVVWFGERILTQEMELIEGVEETVRELREYNELILFTKGHPEEQQMKIDRSGLKELFSAAVIVSEKHVGAYRELVTRFGAESERTWMVGNSPKSDINPALRTGLHAVYIPHAVTWQLELQELEEGLGELLVLEQFRELRHHF